MDGLGINNAFAFFLFATTRPDIILYNKLVSKRLIIILRKGVILKRNAN